jgi:hypothetical protein
LLFLPLVCELSLFVCADLDAQSASFAFDDVDGVTVAGADLVENIHTTQAECRRIAKTAEASRMSPNCRTSVERQWTRVSEQVFALLPPGSGAVG